MVHIWYDSEHICDEGESDLKEGGGQNNSFKWCEQETIDAFLYLLHAIMDLFSNEQF